MNLISIGGIGGSLGRTIAELYLSDHLEPMGLDDSKPLTNKPNYTILKKEGDAAGSTKSSGSTNSSGSATSSTNPLSGPGASLGNSNPIESRTNEEKKIFEAEVSSIIERLKALNPVFDKKTPNLDYVMGFFLGEMLNSGKVPLSSLKELHRCATELPKDPSEQDQIKVKLKEVFEKYSKEEQDRPNEVKKSDIENTKSFREVLDKAYKDQQARLNEVKKADIEKEKAKSDQEEVKIKTTKHMRSTSTQYLEKPTSSKKVKK